MVLVRESSEWVMLKVWIAPCIAHARGWQGGSLAKSSSKAYTLDELEESRLSIMRLYHGFVYETNIE